MFDKSEHDIAKTKSETDLFKKVVTILFLEGGIFSSRDASWGISPTNLAAIGGYFGVVGVAPMFVAEHIEKTLRRQVVFNCGNEHVLLWGPPRASDIEEIAGRMNFFTAHVIKRAEVEFEHLECFSCFNVPTVLEAFASPAIGGEAKELQHKLQCFVKKIANMLGADAEHAVREY